MASNSLKARVAALARRQVEMDAEPFDGVTVADCIRCADTGRPEPDGARRMAVAATLSNPEWRGELGLAADAPHDAILETAKAHGLRPSELAELGRWLQQADEQARLWAGPTDAARAANATGR